MNGEGRDGIRWVVFCAMYPGEERMFDDRSTSEIRAMNSRASGVADALWLAGARINSDDLAARASDGLADKLRALADEWDAEAERYTGYGEGNTPSHSQCRQIAHTLGEKAAELRALLDEDHA